MAQQVTSATVKKAVLEVLAASTAHGISRAAAAKSVPLKIMWSLLFLAFLTLFCISASNLIDKLNNVTVVKSHESDKVEFEFPDLYFCPSLIYSGSTAYTLTESEARQVNDEVDRLNKLYDRMFCSQNVVPCRDWELSTFRRSSRIQQSMPVNLLAKFLMQHDYQSFLIWPKVFSRTFTSGGLAERSLFIHPDNQLCFKARVLSDDFASLTYKRSSVFTWLFVDSHYHLFNFSGARINPIVNPFNKQVVPFQNWQSINGYHSANSLGFTLLIVPRGSYPSLMHVTKLKLSAGKSYQIHLDMQEIFHSQELHGVLCDPNASNMSFQDQLSGERAEYTPSQASCFYTEMAELMKSRFNYLYSLYPRPWHLRDVPRMENMTEIERNYTSEFKELLYDAREFIDSNTQAVTNKCRLRQPCVSKEYSATTTSALWPQVGTQLADFLANEFQSALTDNRRQAGTAKLVGLAQQIVSGNFSTHTEQLFRNYVRESMIEVDISVQSPVSPRLVVAYSYSWLAFLADIGGILGLYIGCSMMTLCELLELAYQLASEALLARRSSAKAATDAVAAAEDALESQPLRDEVELTGTAMSGCTTESDRL